MPCSARRRDAYDEATLEEHLLDTASPRSSLSGSSDSGASSPSSGSSSEDEETVVDESKFRMSKADRRRCAKFKPFNGLTRHAVLKSSTVFLFTILSDETKNKLTSHRGIRIS